MTRAGLLLLLVAAPALAEPPKRHSLVGDMDCAACHTTAGWAVAGGAGFDHARTGFPLTGAHRATPCASCHRPDREITRVCAGCHQDAHGSRLGDSCDACHSPIAWQDVRTSERHGRTRLPLTGMHALLECAACHQRTTDRAWSDVPSDCFACHEKDYRRDIHPDHQGRGGGTPFPRQCSQCHRATGWTPAFVVPRAALKALELGRNHETTFPIRSGKHRGLECAACHLSEDSPRLVSCTGCHAHEPRRLAAQHRGPPGSGCLSCHPGGRAR